MKTRYDAEKEIKELYENSDFCDILDFLKDCPQLSKERKTPKRILMPVDKRFLHTSVLNPKRKY
jgi:hypothetical protein